MSRLHRTLGLPGLTFYGVGIIVGAGVYSVIGAAAGLAGEALWLSFLLAAVVAVLTGLSYAELAAAYPRAGAEYVYIRQAAPSAQWLAFVVGTMLVVAGAATAATVALAFAGYLGSIVALPEPLAATGLLIAVTVLNVVGIQESSWANIAFTALEVGGLVLVIAIGATTPGFGAAVLAAPPAGLWAAAALIFFVYLGFEEIANLAEEARKPGRDVPLAILISIGVTTVLYVLVALAVVALVSPDELASSSSPLATAVAAVSPGLADALGLIALFATANTALIILIAVSRMVLAMARERDVPPILGRLLPGRRSPWVAAVAAMVAALILLPLGGIETVASLSSLGSLLAFAAVNAALVVLRIRDPRRRRPFRVPLSVGRVPVFPVLGVLAIGTLIIQFEPDVYLAGLVVLVIAALIYRARGLWGAR